MVSGSSDPKIMGLFCVHNFHCCEGNFPIKHVSSDELLDVGQSIAYGKYRLPKVSVIKHAVRK